MEQKDFDAEVRAAQRAYFKAWRAANRDKVKANNRRYWERLALKRKKEQQEDRLQQEENA